MWDADKYGNLLIDSNDSERFCPTVLEFMSKGGVEKNIPKRFLKVYRKYNKTSLVIQHGRMHNQAFFLEKLFISFVGSINNLENKVVNQAR